MNEMDLSRQLGDLPEEMIAEAMAPAKTLHRKQVTARALRLAAMAAALAILLTALSFWPSGTDSQGNGIVAVPGVMRVYACELEEAEGSSLEAFELTDAIDSFNRVWVPGVSGLQTGYGIPLTFQLDPAFYEGAEISLHLSVDFGAFFIENDMDDVHQEMVVKNGQTVVWYGHQWYNALEAIDPSGKYYGYVLIYADENLVGYGVIDFLYQYEEGYMPSFCATNFSAYCFPMIDGEYQNVSEEYVWEQIGKYKTRTN